MADQAAERLATAIKASPFAYAVLRLPGYVLELARNEGVPREPEGTLRQSERPEPARIGASGAPAAQVQAPAPGVLHLEVKPGEPVEAGDRVGYVQMHERQVPIVAATAGVVADLRQEDGAFVGYGNPVISITTAEAQPRAAQAVLNTAPGEGGAE